MSSPAPHVAVVVIAHGRHEHLRHQLRSLTGEGADTVVLVAMGDPDLRRVAQQGAPAYGVEVVDLDLVGGELPLAAARNLGASTAIAEGADLLVFLDVDCVVEPGTVTTYADVATSVSASPDPLVLSGEVGYLPEGVDLDATGFIGLGAMANFPDARPSPGAGEVTPADGMDLFWSLSFAMTTGHWQQVGGFDENYVGYGAEDTDFGQRVARAGGSMLWVGSARAFHQWHGSQVPPVQHVRSIVRNAKLFRDRWGWFPMMGWLRPLQEMGLVEWDGEEFVCV